MARAGGERRFIRPAVCGPVARASRSLILSGGWAYLYVRICRHCAQGASAAASVTIDWRALRHCVYFYATKAAAALYRLRAGRAQAQQDPSTEAESAERGAAGHERNSEAAAGAVPATSQHTCAACQLSPPEVLESAALSALRLSTQQTLILLSVPRCCRCRTPSRAGTCTAICARTLCCTQRPAQAFTAGPRAARRAAGMVSAVCSATSG
jgi:hypothetical protein